MSTENNNYIKEIENLLSQGNVSDNIKKLLSNLSTKNTDEKIPEKKEVPEREYS